MQRSFRQVRAHSGMMVPFAERAVIVAHEPGFREIAALKLVLRPARFLVEIKRALIVRIEIAGAGELARARIRTRSTTRHQVVRVPHAVFAVVDASAFRGKFMALHVRSLPTLS